MIFQTQYSIGLVSWAVVAGFSLLSPAIAHTHQQNNLAQASVQMTEPSPLTGSWKLANMTAGNLPTPMLPATDAVPTAEFRDGRIAGFGSCNRFMGGYESEGNRLKIGPLASTFMACEPGVMRQESMYLAALQGAQQYEVTPEGLTISYQTEEGAGVLRFVAQTTDESVGEQSSESVGESVREPVSESPSQSVRGLW